MGRIYLEYYIDEGDYYVCNKCDTHLTSEAEIMSKVRPIFL